MVETAIAAAVGIGTRFISSLFQPTRETEGARLDDLDVPKSQVGIAIPKPYGRRAFKGLNVFWATPLEEVREEEESGGKGGGGGETRINYSYFANFAVAICEGDLHKIEKIWLNGSLVYHNGDSISLETENANELLITDHLTIYLGTNTQNPDPTIQAVEGVGNVPAFKNIAYLVFHDLPLDNFGNRLPKVDVLVQERAGEVSLSDVIRDVITNKTVITNDELITTELNGRTFGGITLKQDGQSVYDFITSLQKVFNFYLREADGKIECIRVIRPSGISAIISEDEIGAHESGSKPNNSYTEEIEQEITLPTTVQIEYQVDNNDLKPGIQHAAKGSIGRDSIENIKTEITAPDYLIYRACQRLLRLTWLHRYKVSDVSLPPNRLNLNVGDVIALELESGTKAIQITKMDIGTNLEIKIAGVAYEADLSDIDFPNFTDPNHMPPGFIERTYTPKVEVPFYGDPESIPLDVPLISDSDSQSGLYHALDTNHSFRNGILYGKYETGSFRRLATITGASPIGQLITSIPATSSFIIDRDTKFTVQLKRGTLDSLPLDTFLNRDQLLLINDELIAVQNATLIAPNRYECSGLIRGCRGTEQAIQLHSVGARVIVIRSESYNTKRINGSVSDLGRELTFKCVPSGRSLSSVATSTTITVEGNSLRPYSPTHPVVGRYHPSKDIKISWFPRARTDGEWRDRVETAMDEPTERYQLSIIYNNAFVRTPIVNTNYYIWSNTTQIADIGLNPMEITIHLSQISSTYGVGATQIYENLKISQIYI